MTLNIVDVRPNGEFLALCEKCGDSKGHLSVNPVKKWCYCFKCGFHRPMTREEVRTIANSDISISPRPYCTDRDAIKDSAFPFMRPIWPLPDAIMGRKVAEYAEGRGFDIREAPIYYSPDKPWYMFFVMRGDDGEMVYCQGRAIKEGMTPKYWCPPVRTNDFIWTLQGGPAYNQIVVTEGIIDAYSIQAKNRLILCVLGSHIKSGQMFAIANKVREFEGELIVMLDSDMPEEAWEMGVQIRHRTYAPVVRVVDWGETEGDPDSIAPELRERLIAESILVPDP